MAHKVFVQNSQCWNTILKSKILAVISVPAQVPGGIYSDLDAFGGIFRNAIYHDYNDVENRWVGRTNWTFTRQFNGACAFFSYQFFNLLTSHKFSF